MKIGITVTGATASGKSTAMRIIANALTQYGADVKVTGEDGKVNINGRALDAPAPNCANSLEVRIVTKTI